MTKRRTKPAPRWPLQIILTATRYERLVLQAPPGAKLHDKSEMLSDGSIADRWTDGTTTTWIPEARADFTGLRNGESVAFLAEQDADGSIVVQRRATDKELFKRRWGTGE